MPAAVPTPAEALDRLIEGNKRFSSGYRSIESLASSLRFKELAVDGQRPFAIVLTCSDARIPVETIFDQGLGDLFVIRVAGNIVLPSIVASVEFAAEGFQTPLCLVMGHTGCGAVRAAFDYSQGQLALESECFRALMHEMEPALKDIKKQNASSSDLDAIATTNVNQSVKRLFAMSPLISQKVKAGSLSIVGGLYDLHTGNVNFFSH